MNWWAPLNILIYNLGTIVHGENYLKYPDSKRSTKVNLRSLVKMLIKHKALSIIEDQASE